MPHMMTTSMCSTYTDSWLRETIRNFSSKRGRNEEWNNNFEQGNGRDIISLESKIKEPKIKMIRKRRGSEASSIDSIGEFYTYLKPRSIELSPPPTHKPNSRSSSPSKNKRGSLTQNIDYMLKIEINEKRLDERAERYTPDQRGRRRSIHYGCASPGIFQSTIINNYLQEFQ